MLKKTEINKKLILITLVALSLNLVSCGGGGGGGSDQQTSPAVNSTPVTPVAEKIIVVGAGLAGLTAARDMKVAGLDVTVLEAREHIGGRTYTDQSTGIPLEMGAHWILGINQSATYELAVEAGVAVTAPFTWNSQGYVFDGSPFTITAEDIASFNQEVSTGCQINYEAQSSTSFEEMAETKYENGNFPYLNRREFDYLISTYIEISYAGDVSLMSASQCWEGSSYYGADATIPGGYSQLSSYLSQGLDIQLNTVVTAVTYNNQGVTITTSKGVYSADRAVMTVPVGVLRSGDIQFSPTLPQSKLDAINLIGSGTINKTWMIFPHTFWDTNTVLFRYMSDPKGHFSEWYSFDNLETYSVLMAFNGGSEAIEMESLTDEEITAEAMTILRTMFGADIPEPVNVIQTRWNSDPFAKGAYSFLRAGAVAVRDRNNLAENVIERLFFAGEATSATNYATTEGAIRSGRKAAIDVLNYAN